MAFSAAPPFDFANVSTEATEEQRALLRSLRMKDLIDTEGIGGSWRWRGCHPNWVRTSI